jgi:DNA-binding NtrC family response regulator
MHKLLIVDDELEILKTLKRLLHKEFKVEICLSADEALTCLASNSFDLVLSDIRMPKMDGFVFLAHCKKVYPDMIRIAISGYADMDRCQTAIEKQDFQFIVSKPWDNFELKNILRLLSEHKSLKDEIKQLRTQVPHD